MRSRFTSGGEKFKKFLDGSSEASEDAAGKPVERSLNFEQVTALTARAGPFFLFLGNALQHIEPVVRTAQSYGQQLWTALEPYHPEDLCYAVYGLCLVFFGGIFMTLVAALEAVHIFGWPKLNVAFRALYNEWNRAAIAFERDNKVRKSRAVRNVLFVQFLTAFRSLQLFNWIGAD